MSPFPEIGSANFIQVEPWQYTHERQAELIRQDGLMCEQHPGQEFEHDPDCAGPGMPWMIEGKAEILKLIEKQ